MSEFSVSSYDAQYVGRVWIHVRHKLDTDSILIDLLLMQCHPCLASKTFKAWNGSILVNLQL